MIEAIGVSDERVRDPAQIEQPVPIGIVPRQARDFQAQHEANASERDLRRQVGEAGAVGQTRPGHTEILVNDGDMVAWPTQIHSAIDEFVLPVGGLVVVFDLGGRRLPDIDTRSAPHMAVGDLEALTHDRSPLQRRRTAADVGRRFSRSVARPVRPPSRGARRRARPTRGRSPVLSSSRGIPVRGVAPSRPFCVEGTSSIEAPSRRRRASTIVRRWSNSERAASVAGRPWVGGGVCRSVHAAGISECVPSGRTSTRCSWPARCDQPKTSSVCPSSGCLRRTIVTRSG